MPFVFAALFLVITILMLIELPPAKTGWPYWDKVQHIIVFFTLAATGYLSFAKNKTWVYLGLVTYGALIECAQAAFTVTRQASIYDWLADVVGILIAIGVITLIRITINSKAPPSQVRIFK
jgi:VanZ family protein